MNGRVIVDYDGMEVDADGPWRLRRGPKDTQVVERRSPGSKRWRTAATLPVRYRRAADGTFTPCVGPPAKR